MSNWGKKITIIEHSNKTCVNCNYFNYYFVWSKEWG